MFSNWLTYSSCLQREKGVHVANSKSKANGKKKEKEPKPKQVSLFKIFNLLPSVRPFLLLGTLGTLPLLQLLLRQILYVLPSSLPLSRPATLGLMSPLAAIGVGASLPAFSIIFGRIFNVFYEDKDEIEGKVTLYSLIFVAIGAFAFVCNFGMVRGFFFLPFNTPPYFLRRRKRNGRCAMKNLPLHSLLASTTWVSD